MCLHLFLIDSPKGFSPGPMPPFIDLACHQKPFPLHYTGFPMLCPRILPQLLHWSLKPQTSLKADGIMFQSPMITTHYSYIIHIILIWCELLCFQAVKIFQGNFYQMGSTDCTPWLPFIWTPSTLDKSNEGEDILKPANLEQMLVTWPYMPVQSAPCWSQW